MFNNLFPKSHASYETMLKYTAKPDRSKMTI